MTKGIRLGFEAQAGSLVTIDALSTMFLLLRLASFFCSISRSPYPGMICFSSSWWFVLSAYICSCSESIVRLLVQFVPGTSYVYLFFFVDLVFLVDALCSRTRCVSICLRTSIISTTTGALAAPVDRLVALVNRLVCRWGRYYTHILAPTDNPCTRPTPPVQQAGSAGKHSSRTHRPIYHPPTYLTHPTNPCTTAVTAI